MNPPAAVAADTVDLLAGTGLARAGATVQRLIGRFDFEYELTVRSNFPRAECGLLVGTEPDPETIWSDTAVDWLFYTSFVLLPPGAPGGQRVSSDFSSPVTAWDVAGQRTIGEGETLWLVYQGANVNDEEDIFFHVFNRALVLGPEE